MEEIRGGSLVKLPWNDPHTIVIETDFQGNTWELIIIMVFILHIIGYNHQNSQTLLRKYLPKLNTTGCLHNNRTENRTV